MNKRVATISRIETTRAHVSVFKTLNTPPPPPLLSTFFVK
jgi:hypothetical protein